MGGVKDLIMGAPKPKMPDFGAEARETARKQAELDAQQAKFRKSRAMGMGSLIKTSGMGLTEEATTSKSLLGGFYG
jgi:hypothetical protein